MRYTKLTTCQLSSAQNTGISWAYRITNSDKKNTYKSFSRSVYFLKRFMSYYFFGSRIASVRPRPRRTRRLNISSSSSSSSSSWAYTFSSPSSWDRDTVDRRTAEGADSRSCRRRCLSLLCRGQVSRRFR